MRLVYLQALKYTTYKVSIRKTKTVMLKTKIIYQHIAAYNGCLHIICNLYKHYDFYILIIHQFRKVQIELHSPDCQGVMPRPAES